RRRRGDRARDHRRRCRAALPRHLPAASLGRDIPRLRGNVRRRAMCYRRAMDVSSLRILEIGDAPLFKRAFPENTLAVWTGNNVAAEHMPGWLNFSLRRMGDLRRRLAGDEFDLVVCQPP